MKKILRLFILLLIAVPFVKVSANTVPITVTPGTDYGGNVYWFGEFDKIGENAQWRKAGKRKETINGVVYGVYHLPSKAYNGFYNGKPVETVCIDPGASAGGSNYTCQSINSANLEEILKNKASYGSGVAYLLAVRMLAAEEGLSSAIKHSSMYWYVQSGKSLSIFGEGSASTVQKGTTGSTINQATSIVQKVKANAGKSSTPGATVFTSEHIGGSGNVHTFRVTSTNALTEVPTVECVSGCKKISNVNWPAGSKTGTIVAELDTTGNNCKMKLKISYKSTGSDGGVYLCSPGGYSGSYVAGASASTEQKMVTYITNDALSASGGTKNTIPGNSGDKSQAFIDIEIPYCEDKCKDCNITTNIEYNVTLCCEGNGNNVSYAYEPKINEIFCVLKKDCNTDEDIKVTGANDIKSKDYLANEINDYCNVYCTEKVNVKIPDALNSKNGKYFKLKGTSYAGYTSNGPLIWGNYACRNVIRYDNWINAYIDEAEEVAKKYNDYQKAQALSDVYDIAYEDGKGGSDHYDVKLTYEGSASTTRDGQNLGCDCNRERTCEAPYDYDKKIPSTSANYKTAKIKYGSDIDHAAGFYKLESVAGNNESVNVAGGLYNIKYTGDSSKYGCTSLETSISTSCGISWQTYAGKDPKTGVNLYDNHEDSISCTSYLKNGKGTKPTDINEGKAWDTARKNANDDVETKKKAYTDEVDKLEKLREKITDCDNFFNENPNTSFVENKIKPANVTFNWFFVYISVDNFVKPYVGESVNYKGSCHFSSNPEYGGYNTDGRGLETPHYDEKNLSHKIATLDIFDSEKNNLLVCNNDSRKCDGISNTKVTNLRKSKDQDQKYTSDTLYTYYCDYNIDNESLKPKFTVYPYGGYTVDNSKFIGAKHENNLYMEYSALYGTYQTYWNFSHIGSQKLDGSGGKFDEYFKSGTDCAGDSLSGSTIDYYCKLSVKTSLSRIKGCDEDKVTTMINGSNYWSNLCCKGGSCRSYIDDTLTFAFKIVDPTNIFPGSKDDDTMPQSGGKDYAQNWFRTNDEIQRKKDIQKNSKDDQLYDPSRITYQFQLNAKALRAIKEYNAAKNEYNSLDGSYTSKKSDALTKFYSSFIDNYYKKQIVMPDNSTVNLGTDNYKDKALETARSRVKWEN